MYGGTVGNESIYVRMKQSDQKERGEKKYTYGLLLIHYTILP